jgi:hypothetical protein
LFIVGGVGFGVKRGILVATIAGFVVFAFSILVGDYEFWVVIVGEIFNVFRANLEDSFDVGTRDVAVVLW